MLLRLISGAEETDFVLLKVTTDTPVTDILQAFLGDNQPFTLISLEGEGALAKYQERNISGEEVSLHDILGWQSGNPPQPLAATVLSKLEKKKEQSKVVVLDCLTELLVLKPEQEVAQLLAKLQKQLGAGVQKSKLVAVLHTDCLEEELAAAVEHSATSVLKVENCLNGEERLVSVRHRKPGGRQVTSKELVSKGKQGGIKVRQYCEKQEKVAVEEEEGVEESINKLTTFNLNTRKESEQEAKSALVLPFYTDEQKRVAGIGEHQGQVNIPGEKKGAIYYEPDSGDDWDDDDPDDDLDF